MYINGYNATRRVKTSVAILGLYLLCLIDFVLDFTVYRNQYKQIHTYMAIIFIFFTFLTISYFIKILNRYVIIETNDVGLCLKLGNNRCINLNWSEINNIQQIKFEDVLTNPEFLNQLQVTIKHPRSDLVDVPGIKVIKNKIIMINLEKSTTDVQHCVESFEDARNKYINSLLLNK